MLPIRLGAGVDAQLADSMTDALVVEVRRRAASAEVFGPNEARALGGSATAGCTDVACFKGVAGGAGVDQVVVSNMGKLEPDDVLSIVLLDAKRGDVLGSAEDRRHGEDVPSPADRIARAVAVLFSTSEPAVTASEGEQPIDPWTERKGRLDLRLHPDGSAALLDGRPLPLGDVASLPVGVHRLQIFAASLKLAREMAVDIHVGETTLLDVDLTTAPPAVLGRLQIKAAPGTDVYVDGDRVGVAPLAAFALPVGMHRVRLVNPAKRAAAESDVKISANFTTHLARDLTPSTAAATADNGPPEQLDRAHIADALAHGHTEFAACVDKLHAEGAQNGTLKISFRILADGRPADLRVSPAADDPRLVEASRCLGDAVARLDFGRYRGPTLPRVEQPVAY